MSLKELSQFLAAYQMEQQDLLLFFDPPNEKGLALFEKWGSVRIKVEPSLIRTVE